MKEPLRFLKTADKTKNRIIIPKMFIDKYGSKFIMEIYEDKIVIKPLNIEEK